MDNSEPLRSDEPEPARQLGKYRLLEVIGSGAMGDVYRAEHVMLKRKVAIKIMHAELACHEELVERFFCEARAVNLIGHPHVLEISDFAREPDGTVWLVMELLEGCDLATLVRSQRIALPRALTIARQLCSALAATHSAGIVHCDVKPENVFVLERHGGDFIKLIDFGIARLPEPDCETPQVGVVMGSPPYMAPEQARGLLADERSDLYAVGAVLYELVTGVPLYRRSSLEALLYDVVHASPVLASSLVQLPAPVAEELDRLFAYCLAKDPALRPESALALDAALAALADRLRACERQALELAAPADVAPLARVDELADAGRQPRWAMRMACAAAALIGATASALLTDPAASDGGAPAVAASVAGALPSPAEARPAPAALPSGVEPPAETEAEAAERQRASESERENEGERSSASAGEGEDARESEGESEEESAPDGVQDGEDIAAQQLAEREAAERRTQDDVVAVAPARAMPEPVLANTMPRERGRAERVELDPEKLLDPFRGE